MLAARQLLKPTLPALHVKPAAHATQAASTRYELTGHTAVTCKDTPEETTVLSDEKDRVRRLEEETKANLGRVPPEARKSSGEATNWPPSTTLKKSYPPSVENAVKEAESTMLAGAVETVEKAEKVTESIAPAGAVRVRVQASELA